MRKGFHFLVPLFVGCMFLSSPFFATGQDHIPKDKRTGDTTLRDHTNRRDSVDVQVKSSVGTRPKKDTSHESTVSTDTRKDNTQEKSKPFFETAPGFLTALAALITAIVGLIQVFKKKNNQ